MAEWIRRTLTAELLSDAHFGSGSGNGVIDAIIARDRCDKPVIWASHIEGVLRDAARRLRGDAEARDFFGSGGGQRQRAIFTSLYTHAQPPTRVWRSSARSSFDNRAPKDDTLRALEHVPSGTVFEGEVELLTSDLPTLKRLIQEVDALGSGRSSGAGRIKLKLSDTDSLPTTTSVSIETSTGHLRLLLRNRDPLCITATATPDNLIPSLAFIPGRTLLGALAAWLINEGDRETASLLTSGTISVSDALPLPDKKEFNLVGKAEVLPAPLTLLRPKPAGCAESIPWWAQPQTLAARKDAWDRQPEAENEKLKRPEDDLFVCRTGPSSEWITYRPKRRIRLRNGRPDPKMPEPTLFAIEQIVEKTFFLGELHGPEDTLKKLATKLSPILQGQRWLRVGRAGAPVEVVQLAWSDEPPASTISENIRLILTSDLLVRDDYLRWRTSLDEKALREVTGIESITLRKNAKDRDQSLQDSVAVHGFNGTSRLWRMPAMAIRRGSVFEISGKGIEKLAQRAAKGEWLGERTHEGFGRFRLEKTLPGVTLELPPDSAPPPTPDADEEQIASATRQWFEKYKVLAKTGNGNERKPSLSQWFDLVTDLERKENEAFTRRLNPQTSGEKNWAHPNAKEILNKLKGCDKSQQAAYARFFVRWLRAAIKQEGEKQ